MTATDDRDRAHVAALRAVLEGDAERLAGLLQQGAGDKSARQASRAALALAWRHLTTLEGVEGEPVGTAAPTTAELAELKAAYAAVEVCLRQMGDDRGAAARPLQEVRVARPMPDRVMVPPSSRQTDALARSVDRHFRAHLALTPERIKWFDDRAAQTPPTRVAEVKPPEGDQERQDLELLRKAGKSKFS